MMICASMWFEFYGGLLQCQELWYIGWKYDNKEGNLNWERLFPRFWDISEGVKLRRMIL